MMERHIILASHGKLASGMLNSFELICGGHQTVSTLDCYLTEEFDLDKEVRKIMEENEDKELIVITDLFGGSVNNEFLKYIGRTNYYLVAGMNLPFLIEFMTQVAFVKSQEIESTIKVILNSSKETIQYCNEAIQKDLIEEEF